MTPGPAAREFAADLLSEAATEAANASNAAGRAAAKCGQAATLLGRSNAATRTLADELAAGGQTFAGLIGELTAEAANTQPTTKESR